MSFYQTFEKTILLTLPITWLLLMFLGLYIAHDLSLWAFYGLAGLFGLQIGVILGLRDNK